jgi:hypothetical protein
MKFFPNSEKTADKKLADATAERDAAVVRLAVAQGAVSDCAKALNQLAAQGADDATLDAGEAKLDKAERRVLTLRPALADKETLLAALEAARAETLDKNTRTSTAAEVAALADDLIELAGAYDASTAALAEVCQRALIISNEMSGMATFTTSSRTEVALAIPVLGEVLRNYGRQVLDGTAPATLPTQENPFKPTIPVKPVTTRLFATRAVRWVDSSGETKLSRKWVDVDLPPETAERALKSGVCLPLDHPMRRTHLNQSPAHVDPSWCTSLDVDDTEVAQPSLAEPEPIFTPIDRGPVFKLRVAAGGAS